MENKGQVNLEVLGALAVTLVVVGLTVVIGLLIFAEVKNVVVDNIDSNQTVNESVIWVNSTFVALRFSPNSVTLTCDNAINGTGNATVAAITIGSGNFTCSSQGFNLTDDGTRNYNTTVFVTYTHKQADLAFNGTSEVQNATSDIPTWLSIIVITVIGAFLIGLIAFFRNRN